MNTFTTTTASAPAVGTITLVTGRQYVRHYARNAGSATVYGDRDIDIAMTQLGNRFLRVTRYLTVSSDVATTTAAPSTLDVSAIATLASANLSFEPRRLERAYIEGGEKPLAQVEYDSLLWKLANAPATATPTTLSWTDPTTAILYPTPTAAPTTITLKWWQPFTLYQIGSQGAWSSATQYYTGDVVSSGGHAYQALSKNLNVAVATAATWLDLGTGITVATPASLSLNIPGDVWSEIAIGAAALLQKNQPKEAASANLLWQDYLAVEAAYCGEAGDGSNYTETRSFTHGVDGD